MTGIRRILDSDAPIRGLERCATSTDDQGE
jgi:hypothetical protein